MTARGAAGRVGRIADRPLREPAGLGIAAVGAIGAGIALFPRFENAVAALLQRDDSTLTGSSETSRVER